MAIAPTVPGSPRASNKALPAMICPAISPMEEIREGFDSNRVQKARIRIHWGGDTPSRIEFYTEK